MIVVILVKIQDGKNRNAFLAYFFGYLVGYCISNCVLSYLPYKKREKIKSEIEIVIRYYELSTTNEFLHSQGPRKEKYQWYEHHDIHIRFEI